MEDEKASLVNSEQSESSSTIGSGKYGGIINVPENQPQERHSGICADLERNWRHIRYGRERLLPVLKCTLIAALGACLNGFVLGYSSMTQLNIKKHFPDAFTEDYFFWIGSSATFGALFGGPVAGIIADKFGRKTALMFSTVPLLLGWLAISISVEHFYWPVSGNYLFTMLVVGRVLSGFGSGWVSLVVPLYIVEISPAMLKGLFGSFNQLAVTIGILVIYLLGTWVDYWIVALVVLGIVLVFAVLLQLVPETPRWLVANSERLLANSILYKLRGPRANVVQEMELLEKVIASEEDLTFAHKVSMLKKRAVFIPFVLSLCLMFFQQFSGINVVIFYAGNVLKEAMHDSDKASLYADLGVGVVQVIATFIAVLLIDILGRRILLISGGTLLTLSTGVLGLYFYLAPSHDSKDFYFLAIACLVVFTIGFSIGWGPIPWVMMGELAPTQVRGLLSGIATALNWGFAAVITSSFNSYEGAVGAPFAWWTFTVCIGLSIPFVFFFIPETKGKDLQDIQDYFDHRYGIAANGSIQRSQYDIPGNE